MLTKTLHVCLQSWCSGLDILVSCLCFYIGKKEIPTAKLWYENWFFMPAVLTLTRLFWRISRQLSRLISDEIWWFFNSSDFCYYFLSPPVENKNAQIFFFTMFSGRCFHNTEIYHCRLSNWNGTITVNHDILLAWNAYAVKLNSIMLHSFLATIFNKQLNCLEVV